MTTIVPHVRSVKVGTEELDVDALLRHDFEDVREASEKLPGAIAWLGWQRAYFKEQLYLAEIGVKTVKGQIYLRYRTEGMEADGYSGKPTETAIEHAIHVHPDFIAQCTKAAKFERIVSNLSNCINALEAKIELVRTGEATHRRLADHELPTDEELENIAQAKTKGDS